MGIRSLAVTAAAIGIFAVPASALVVQSQSGIMTSEGQDFAFDFAGLARSNGTGGKATISSGPATTAQSIDDGFDLDGVGDTADYEYFTVFADDLSLGTYDCAGKHGTTIPGFTMNGEADCIFSLEIPVAVDALDSVIGDGAMTLAVNFASGVGHFGDGDRLDVSLSYEELAPIPLPATGLMLLGSLVAVGAIARRRTSGPRA
jgi:hypothetical protein